MATGYVDFYDKKGNGSAVRVNYEETVNQAARTSTIRITSVQVMSTARYQYVFYGCGSVCVTGNGSGTTTVLTMANSNTHQAYVGALNTWCTISNTSCSGVTVPNSGASDGAIISLVSYTGYSDFNVFCSGYAAGNIEITAPSHRNIGLTSYSNAPTQNPSTISMPGSATVGDLVSISINSESTSYRHNLSYSFNGSSWTPIVSNLSSSSYSWDTSNTAPDFGSEIQKTCYVRCVTTSGNSQVGDAQIASIVLSIGGSITLNAITVTPVNDNTVIRNWSGGSLFVQGYTRAQVAVSCTPSPGASLSVCRISINGTVIGEGTATTVTTNSPIAESGTLTVSVLVTDSRGNSATDSTSINVYPYTRPYATFANAIRYSGNVNTEDKDNGTNLSAKATIAYSSVNGNNSASVKVRFKAAGGTYPTSYTTLTSGSASYKKINSSAVSTEESYTVQFVISDALHAADADPTTIEITIPTKSVVLHARDGGSNLSIGGYGTDGIDGFEVHWDTFLRARLILGGTMYGVAEPSASGNEEVGQVYFQLIDQAGSVQGGNAGMIDGSNIMEGSITRDKLARDALYSPTTKPTAANYSIVGADIGKTITDNYNLRNSALTWAMSKDVADDFPIGTEIAFARIHNTISITIQITGARMVSKDNGRVGAVNTTTSLKLPGQGSMCKLKKVENDSTNGSFWILTGDAEVVS